MAEDSTFGDDTPGIYIRGIDAIGYADHFRRVTERLRIRFDIANGVDKDIRVAVLYLEELAELLDECRAR